MSATAKSETSIKTLKERIIAHVDSLRGEIIETSRHLHDNPELSGEEYNSSKYLANRAGAQGFKVETGISDLPTPFKAPKPSSPSNATEPLIAFPAEYDALPVVGPGFGHNKIGTRGTFAAIAPGPVADQLPGDV